MSVLVVEDDPGMAEILASALRARGHEVQVAATGRECLRMASLVEPDLVVLDLGLPDIDGADVCRQLRRWFLNPIVVLSADADEGRKVAALDGGADDYVTKPFSMPELLARLRVAARHRQAVAAALGPAAVTIGDLRIDTTAHTAAVDGRPLHLARKEFALLALLSRNSGRLFTHSELVAHLWGRPDAPKTEAVRGLVAQLRKKLGDGPARPQIVTDAGLGYRIVDAEGTAAEGAMAPAPQGSSSS